MTDQSTPPAKSLYAKREPVYPQKIDGRFRRLKWLIMAVTLTIYYVTPWLRWDRGAYAPDQAVLLDVANRRFYFGPLEIWPHEFYYVAGLLIMAGVGLFLLTSVVGRAWCGYACPQTVWTDLFQHIDRFVDGDRNAQMRLAKSPWNASKLARRTFKYAVYLVLSLATGGAWIFYFADAPTLAQKFVTGEASTIAYSTVAILTATTFTFGGFMREQVCIYMCPWPRIQTAMTDEKSLIVTYKDWRGEPRGSVKQAAKAATPLGDCIDCRQCVAVCPTGIDIREGPQIGCITCALCIDACDRVMAEIGRPRGLIDYATLEDCKREAAGEPARPAWKALTHPRTLIYLGIWSAIGLALLFALGARTHVDLSAAQDRNPPFMLMSDGAVRNAYTLKLRNMQSRPRTMEIALTGLPGAMMWTDESGRDQASRAIRVRVDADAIDTVRAYVIAAPGTRPQPFAFRLRTVEPRPESDRSDVRFAAPGEEP